MTMPPSHPDRRSGRPRAVLFDLFHTLVCVPPPSIAGGTPIADMLGVSASEWRRVYYEDDVLGRCVGRIRDPLQAMRLVAHAIDPTVPEERIRAAADARSALFERGLVDVDPRMLAALDRLRAAGVRTALVSDAGADDVEAWPRSPLSGRLDVVAFSYDVGVRKPDERIYRHALAAVGTAPADAMFVGDGGSSELRGAREVGLRTVLVTRLLDRWWPGRAMTRSADADEVHDDVPAFVDALLGR